MKFLTDLALRIFIASVLLFTLTSITLAHWDRFTAYLQEEVTEEPAESSVEAPDVTPAETPPGVVPADDFLRRIVEVINDTLLQSAVASGALVLTLVDLVKLLPIDRLRNPDAPGYIPGTTLQAWIGGAIVILFWVAPVGGFLEEVSQGYNILELILPLIVQMIVILTGAFGLSYAAHSALSNTAIPIFGARSQRT